MVREGKSAWKSSFNFKGQLTSVVFPCISSPKDILVTPAAKSYMHTLLTGESKLINIRM